MDKQWYTKHFTENQRLSNTNNIKQTEVNSYSNSAPVVLLLLQIRQ
jgi:hypothetical protein